jgi:hypothetical protein
MLDIIMITISTALIVILMGTIAAVMIVCNAPVTLWVLAAVVIGLPLAAMVRDVRGV